MAIPYLTVESLAFENELARSILDRMKNGNGVYIPPDFQQGRFVHFALDNIDFQEDAHDGRNTLHGTVMDAYQRHVQWDLREVLTLESSNASLQIPASLYTRVDCTISTKQKPNAIGNRYDGNKGRDLTTPSSNVDEGVCANPFLN